MRGSIGLGKEENYFGLVRFLVARGNGIDLVNGETWDILGLAES